MNEDEETKSSMEEGASMNKINLLEVDIDSTNTALNVIVGFLGLAQKRGAFAINESAKKSLFIYFRKYYRKLIYKYEN